MLKIWSTSASEVSFSLELTWNPSSSDDGTLTRNGGIESGLLRREGSVWRYRPDQSEQGRCDIGFRFSGTSVTAKQNGSCDWFGEQVIADGVYKLTTAQEPRVITTLKR